MCGVAIPEILALAEIMKIDLVSNHVSRDELCSARTGEEHILEARDVADAECMHNAYAQSLLPPTC